MQVSWYGKPLGESLRAPGQGEPACTISVAVNGHMGEGRKRRYHFLMTQTSETAPVLQAPVDLEGFNELTGGDIEFAVTLVRNYQNSSRELLTQMRACLARDDRRQLARSAHQLAGASANVYAAPLRSLCSNLEQVAPTANAAQLERQIAELATELTRVHYALANTITDGSSVSEAEAR